MKVYIILVTNDLRKMPITPVTMSKTFRPVGDDNYIGVGEVELPEGKIGQLTNIIYEKCNFSESQKNVNFTFKFHKEELDPEKNVSDYDFEKELIPKECVRIFAYF